MVQSPDDGPVQEFLNSLRRPCGHLLNMFRELGVDTADDLDTLCLAGNHHLEQAKKYLVDHGMSTSLWLVIREGLRARAQRLSMVPL